VSNGVSASVTGGSTVVFNTTPVVVDPGRFTGEWMMAGVVSYTTGVATIDLLPLMEYGLTLGESPMGMVYFGVDENGDVTEDFLERSINSYRLHANVLTLNETTVFIEPEGGATWRISRISPDPTGTVGSASVVLVPDVDFRVALKVGSDFETYTHDFTVVAPCRLDQRRFVLNSVAFKLTCQLSLERVVEADLAAPDTGGASFTAFGQSTIDDDGGFAVRGLLGEGGVTGSTDAGIWTSGSPDLAMLDLFVRENDVAPGTSSEFGDSGFQFSSNLSPVHNAFAEVAFQAPLVDGRSGIWMGNASSLVLVAITGMSPIGTGGATFCSFQNTLLNDQGQVAFVAGLDAGPGCLDRAGIWLYTPGAVPELTEIARLGNVAPGVSDGSAFSFLHDPVLNHRGDIAFIAGLGASDSEAVFAGNPRSGPAVDLFGRLGEPVQGQVGVTFESAFVSGSLGLNSDGTLTIVSGNRDPGFFWGLWSGDYRSPSSLNLIVRAAQPTGGDPAPGFDPGVTFRLTTRATINDEGEIALQAFVNQSANTSALDSGIWFVRSDGVVELVARTNAPIPSYGSDTIVPENSVFLQALNARGDVLFKAFAEGPGFSPPDLGFWVSVPGKREHPVLAAISGQQIEVDAEVRRLSPLDINFATVGSTSVAGPAQLDDLGRLLVRGATIDSTGIVRNGIFLASVNRAPIADAGSDQRISCTSADATLVSLDGSNSSDPDGDALTFNWTGPFPENGGTESGKMPVVTLPVGTSTVELVVNDGDVDSDLDSVDVTVVFGLTGLQPPFMPLVPAGEPANLPNKAFKRGRTLPLKLSIACSAGTLTDTDVTAPIISTLVRIGDAPLDLDTIDLDSGEANDDGLAFRYSDDAWIYNLNTANLVTGAYQIDILMPDGELYSGGFILR
jgi:hypothetical protein